MGTAARCEDLPLSLPQVSQFPEKATASQEVMFFLKALMRYLHFYFYKLCKASNSRKNNKPVFYIITLSSLTQGLTTEPSLLSISTEDNAFSV